MSKCIRYIFNYIILRSLLIRTTALFRIWNNLPNDLFTVATLQYGMDISPNIILIKSIRNILTYWQNRPPFKFSWNNLDGKVPVKSIITGFSLFTHCTKFCFSFPRYKENNVFTFMYSQKGYFYLSLKCEFL